MPPRTSISPTRTSPAAARAWLRSGPSLDELKAVYPAEWEPVEYEIGRAVAAADYERLADMTARAARPVAPAPARGGGKAGEHALILAEVRRQMTVAALRQVRAALATGIDDGTVRFNRVNGWLLQRLFFARALERKPVSMARFRVSWRLARQRRFLMTLVQPKGIYCFYAKPLVTALAALVDGRRCIEIAAGDGTLARFLTAAGTEVTATDDHSWSDRITFPDAVRRQDAVTALCVHQPQVVLCSWPPTGNRFEREVFRTRSVETYVVILPREEAAAGSWDEYRRQQAFAWAEAPELSRLVLPPELDPVVLVFHRKATAGSGR